MRRAGDFLKRFATDEGAAASVEYALLSAFVFGGIILDADALRTAVVDELAASPDCLDITAQAAGC